MRHDSILFRKFYSSTFILGVSVPHFLLGIGLEVRIGALCLFGQAHAPNGSFMSVEIF